MSFETSRLPPLDQQSGFAIPIVAITPGNPPKVGDALALCYGVNHFCLIDERGEQVGTLTHRHRLADIEFASFWTGRPHTHIVFDEGEFIGVVDKKHARHLRLFIELELAKSSPKLLDRLSIKAKQHFIGNTLFAVLGIFVVIAGILAKTKAAKFGAPVIAIAIAGMIRTWLEMQRLNRIRNPQALEAVTQLEQVANELPDAATLLSELPAVRNRFLRSERLAGLAGLSTFGSFATLATAALLWLYALDGLTHHPPLPKIPQRPMGAAVSKPIPPFEIPATPSELVVVGPDSERFEVTFARQSTPFGWWVARNVVATCGAVSIEGQSVEDPPFREWSRDLVTNGLGDRPRYSPVVPRVRFDRPADGWPRTEMPALLSASIDFVTPNTDWIPRYVSSTLTIERHLLVLDAPQFSAWEISQQQVGEYARWKSEVDAYNASIAEFNQQLNSQLTHREARRTKEISCLALIIVLTTVCVGVPLIQKRIIRLILNSAVAGTALYFMVDVVQLPKLPDPVEPIPEAVAPMM